MSVHISPSSSTSLHRPTLDRRTQHRGNHPLGRLRTQLRLSLTLAAPGAHARELFTGDLSSGGSFVECPNPPLVGERALVEVQRPRGGVAFVTRGRVVWHRLHASGAGRPAGFGLRFEPTDASERFTVHGTLTLLQRQHVLRTASNQNVRLYSLDDVAFGAAQTLGTVVPQELGALLENYHKANDRRSFLWRWAYQGIYVATLPGVASEFLPLVQDCKELAIMYAVLLDDVMDRSGSTVGPWRDVLEGLCLLPFQDSCPAPQATEHPYLSYGKRTLRALRDQLMLTPRFAEFWPLVRLDLQQLAQDARYQSIVRAAPQHTSMMESFSHAPVGLTLHLAASIDLCASPGFDSREVGLLRELMGHAQRMTYISQLLSGWSTDYNVVELSSPMMAHGVSSGILSPNDLDPARADWSVPRLVVLLREARVDSHFLTEWLRARQHTRELCARLRSINLEPLLQAYQRMLWIQIGQGRGEP